MDPLVFRDSKASDLTKAVRPFTTPLGQPSRKRTERGFYFGTPTYVPPGTTTDGQTVPVGTLRWSASQDAQVSTLASMGFEINWADDPNNAYAETVRNTHTERVFQNNDPASPNWVDVEVIDSIQFKSGKQKLSDYTLND